MFHVKTRKSKYDTQVHLLLNTEFVKLHTLNYDGCTNPGTLVVTDTCVILYTYSTHKKKINKITQTFSAIMHIYTSKLYANYAYF